MRATRHNGRSGKHGTYDPKHNDRRFDLANSEHIDPDRARQNVYWNWLNGWSFGTDHEKAETDVIDFSEVERIYYEQNYSNFIRQQNARNAKTRHTERNRSIEDLLTNNKTCPEETIYQIGTIDKSASKEKLLAVFHDFRKLFEKRYGAHVHILDWALHIDEGTPHIHERHVFDCRNKYGELCPQQEKALEELGIPLPDPDKPKGRNNNRKQTFDAACRDMLYTIAAQHGINLEVEPEYGGREYMEKLDYVRWKQMQIIEDNNALIDAQTQKIDEMGKLVEEVSAQAYDKAVEVVTEAVREETRKEDLKILADYKVWLLSPERNASQGVREYAADRLDSVMKKIRSAMSTAVSAMREKLAHPEVRNAGIAEIQERARESVLAKLSQKKNEFAVQDAEIQRRKEKRRSRGFEL